MDLSLVWKVIVIKISKQIRRLFFVSKTNLMINLLMVYFKFSLQNIIYRQSWSTVR